ncbi:hypothetical protein JCGZ_14496 [Jatropha curcas]|uniref:Phytocyanin domain-containing protein n=1 Tax=Jatropha curcas TaxID=180498 RepID=A0A067K8Z9_JATCU|nr:cucumber peeling cupredoxin [Jatropha curcas]KDP28725.1 hypothetical protein JCGZ_14496 [Jatropha curcas]
MTAATFMRVTITALMIAAAASQTRPTAYTNHTVGGNAGWFFNSTTNTAAAANYSSWAAAQTFNLGDFLIFNTNSNQTVIQTYNESTFRSCTTDDALDSDTFQFGGGSTAFGEALTIPVALTIEGPNYFFSDADDGSQCQHGLAFEIQVNHGLGLPPSLNQPPPPPYIEPPGPDSAQPPPITIAGGSETPLNYGVKDGADMRRVACAVLFAVAGVTLLRW